MSEDMDNVTNGSTDETAKQGAGAPGVRFSPEQQDFFNTTINKKYAEWKKKEDARVSALEDKLKQFEANNSRKDDSVAANINGLADGKQKVSTDELLKQMQDKLAESQRIIEQNKAKEENWVLLQKNLLNEKNKFATDLLNEKKSNMIANACVKEDFINPNQVRKLVDDYVVFDEDSKQWKVYSESGEERFDEQLKPMSIEGFIKEFALKNPHLVKGAKIGGAGSQEGSRVSGKKWKRSEINNLPLSEYERLEPEIFKAMKEGRVIDG